jgi:hypothetical protein
MVVDSIIMTICISPFLKPYLDFDFMPKKFSFKYIPFVKNVHTFQYGVMTHSKFLDRFKCEFEVKQQKSKESGSLAHIRLGVKGRAGALGWD